MDWCVPLKFHHRRPGAILTADVPRDLSEPIDLVKTLVEDERPEPDVVQLYGIESRDHYKALQFAVLGGVTAYDLEIVQGDGEAITALVRCVFPQPYSFVRFQGEYDKHWYAHDQEPWYW